jgi:hypothetical protein
VKVPLFAPAPICVVEAVRLPPLKLMLPSATGFAATRTLLAVVLPPLWLKAPVPLLPTRIVFADSSPAPLRLYVPLAPEFRPMNKVPIGVKLPAVWLTVPLPFSPTLTARVESTPPLRLRTAESDLAASSM